MIRRYSQTSYKWCFLPTIEMKDYNVVIDGKIFFDQPVRNDLTTYENIREIATDDYTTGSSLGYPYFKEHYKMIAIDLSKQQAVDVDPKALQH